MIIMATEVTREKTILEALHADKWIPTLHSLSTTATAVSCLASWQTSLERLLHRFLLKRTNDAYTTLEDTTSVMLPSQWAVMVTICHTRFSITHLCHKDTVLDQAQRNTGCLLPRVSSDAPGPLSVGQYGHGRTRVTMSPRNLCTAKKINWLICYKGLFGPGPMDNFQKSLDL